MKAPNAERHSFSLDTCHYLQANFRNQARVFEAEQKQIEQAKQKEIAKARVLATKLQQIRAGSGVEWLSLRHVCKTLRILRAG